MTAAPSIVDSAMTRHLLAAACLLLSAAIARGQADCPPGTDVTLWVGPQAPAADAPLRITAIAEHEPPGGIVVRDPSGRDVVPPPIVHSGPPWSVVTSIDDPVPGSYRIEVRRDGVVVACRRLDLPATAARRAVTWEGRSEWDRATTNLFAVWIEHLFGADAGQPTTLRGLAEVLQDPERNLLYEHLRLGEDEPGPRALALTPDCADLPYILRAYFAWKLDLPFGMRACGRGGGDTPPRCGQLITNARARSGGDALASFKSFLRTVADTAQSGSVRTALDDDATDYYPVALTRETLRPGTIFADPYGHTLVLVRWVPQTPERPGLILAVDAQPDNSMGYKRFWEGTFLFAEEPGAGPGWKAFRPLVRTPSGVRTLDNDELDAGADFTPWSGEQATLDPDDFYAHMAALINPDRLSPGRAYDTTLDALVEQVETRIGSVDTGERWKQSHPGYTIPMPAGAAIFETTGPWEDYATPSRDMRLLIAMHVLETLPARIVRYPELFVLQGRSPAEVRDALETVHAQRIGQRHITYTRSDGSPWRLTIADVLARRAAFTMAYNPNDCVEVRWGAPEDGPERTPCRRRAPAEQRSRMEQYRTWFATMRRPSR